MIFLWWSWSLIELFTSVKDSLFFLWHLWHLWHLNCWPWHFKNNFKCHWHLNLFCDISNLSSNVKCHFWHFSFVLLDFKLIANILHIYAKYSCFPFLIWQFLICRHKKADKHPQNHINPLSQIQVKNHKTHTSIIRELKASNLRIQ